MIRLTVAAVVLLALAITPFSWRGSGVRVGSKKFTESVVLGELLSMLIQNEGLNTTHYRELGGTKLVFQALLNGDIDVYPEYTGTIAKEILAGQQLTTEDAIREALNDQGVQMSRPLGFNNTYALGMNKERAGELGITKISDLTRHPDLSLGFSNEFMDREDGWNNLKTAYGLPQRNVRGLDHDLAYRQLRLGAIDVIDVYTTDAKIELHDLAVLQDDRQYFPRYDAVVLYRDDLTTRHPSAVEALRRLESSLDEPDMMKANGRVELDRTTEARVAADMLDRKFGITLAVEEETTASQVFDRTLEHLDLVRKSLIPAILIAIPLGIVASKSPRFGQIILALVGIVQTIPALALLVILMPLMAYLGLLSIGLGSATAVTALLLYSLLPIVRNTYASLHGIAGEYRESALALGLPAGSRLLKIELPLASRGILAGIKTAAVINVGFATLGALIGAGGYGQPIITGIRLNDTGLILQGAIPAAALALLVQGGFEVAERYFVPRGLRIQRSD